MLTTQNNPWVKDFPILAADENGNRLVYLDSAATTQHPKQVLDAVANYYLHDNANPTAASMIWPCARPTRTKVHATAWRSFSTRKMMRSCSPRTPPNH